MGDHHDRGEPANQFLNAAVWLCAILSARCGTKIGDHGAYLSRDHPVCDDPGRGLVAAVVRAVDRHNRAVADEVAGP